MKNIKLYDLHGSSALDNFSTLITPDEKYLYWNNGKFKNYALGDVVFWVNREKEVAYYSVVDSVEVLPTFENRKNYINDAGYSLYCVAEDEKRFPIFFRFKIKEKRNIPTDWNYVNLSTFSGHNMAVKIYEDNINEPDKKIEKIGDLIKIFNEGEASADLIDASSILYDLKNKHDLINKNKRNIWFVCQGLTYKR